MGYSFASPSYQKRYFSGSRILTAYPSPTLFSLSLGPTNPEQINFTLGNLRLSAFRFLIGIIATYTCIISSGSSTLPYDRVSPYNRMLSYPFSDIVSEKATVLVIGLSPDNFRRRTTWPVSYYALFKGWLLLSQPPGCLSNSTSFTT